MGTRVPPPPPLLPSGARPHPQPRAARTAKLSPAAPAGPPPLPPSALRRRPQRRGAPTSGRLARRSLAAGWELLLRSRGRAVDPPPTPDREPRRFAGAAPKLAPCRPLIGAPGRPLGREARRPSAALGAHGRGTSGGGKEGGRAPGKGRGASGASRVAATTSPPPFPLARPALSARPAARAANQRPRCSGCEPRNGGLESEGRRRSLIGPASPVERGARRGRDGGRRRAGVGRLQFRLSPSPASLEKRLWGGREKEAQVGKQPQRSPILQCLGPGPLPRSLQRHWVGPVEGHCLAHLV